MLIYLYSALDRRPVHYRLLLGPVNLLRSVVCNVQNAMFRKIFTWITALFLYMPFIALGHFLKLFRLSHLVPIFDFYHGKSHICGIRHRKIHQWPKGANTYQISYRTASLYKSPPGSNGRQNIYGKKTQTSSDAD